MLSSCNDESGKDAAILQELKEVSNRHSQSNNNKNANAHQTPSVIKGDVKPRDDGMEKENSFLAQTGENRELNQYWYSKHTIAVLCNAIREQLQRGGRVAFLSTPSLFFSLSPKEREQCVLFDFDTSWEQSCPQFNFYDYNNSANIKEGYQGVFDLIVIDPPFISESVWEQYANTARLLMTKSNANVIATTVDENAELLKALFGCQSTTFKPSIPNLVYQYSVFTNFASDCLNARNPEIPLD